MYLSDIQKLEKGFEKATLSIYWKEKNGNYLGINPAFLKGYGIESANEIVGFSDVDMWKGETPLFHINDQKVMHSRRATSYIEKHLYQNENRIYLSHKTPFFSDRTGKILGVFGISVLLNKDGVLDNIEIPSELNEYLPTIYKSNDKGGSLANFQNQKLTKRQKECLYYLSKGMTMKQIALMLNLSPRTVEHHLEAIKIKFDCQTRADLIGLLY